VNDERVREAADAALRAIMLIRMIKPDTAQLARVQIALVVREMDLADALGVNRDRMKHDLVEWLASGQDREAIDESREIRCDAISEGETMRCLLARGHDGLHRFL